MGKIRLCHYIRHLAKISSLFPNDVFLKPLFYRTPQLLFNITYTTSPHKNTGYICAETPTTSSKMKFFVTIGFTVSGCNTDRARKFDV